jgi:hypothetical protein
MDRRSPGTHRHLRLIRRRRHHQAHGSFPPDPPQAASGVDRIWRPRVRATAPISASVRQPCPRSRTSDPGPGTVDASSSRFAIALSRLRRGGTVRLRWQPGTGAWSYNNPASFWHSNPSSSASRRSPGSSTRSSTDATLSGPTRTRRRWPTSQRSRAPSAAWRAGFPQDSARAQRQPHEVASGSSIGIFGVALGNALLDEHREGPRHSEDSRELSKVGSTCKRNC